MKRAGSTKGGCIPHPAEAAGFEDFHGICRSENNAAEETLLLRHALREKFMAGRVEEACRLLEKSPYKNLLGFQSGDSTVDQNLDVYFFVKCLAFIELIR